MSSILNKLQYLEFPACTKEALSYLVRTLSADPHHGIPGLGGAKEKFTSQVAQEYVVEVTRRKARGGQKLNSMHELQLLELVCCALHEAPEQACYSVFSAIFGGHLDNAKTSLMTKLVSMAISISGSAVLGCAALWMQEQGSQSVAVCGLAQALVDDYCLLYPPASPAFRRLPAIAPLFTCNLVTALTTIYTYTDASKCPPRNLLECIVDWISDDPCLCSDSVRLVRIRSNFTCPIGGLVRWCILGPLVTCSDSVNSKPPQIGSSEVSKAVSEEASERLMGLFSRLHLGVLLSLQAYRSMELKEQLLTYTDLYIVSKTLAAYHRDGQCSDQMLHTINLSVDRLAQTVQVAMTAGALSDKFDVRQICEGLPANRLLQMIVALQQGQPREAMDIS